MVYKIDTKGAEDTASLVRYMQALKLMVYALKRPAEVRSSISITEDQQLHGGNPGDAVIHAADLVHDRNR